MCAESKVWRPRSGPQSLEIPPHRHPEPQDMAPQALFATGPHPMEWVLQPADFSLDEPENGQKGTVTHYLHDLISATSVDHPVGDQRAEEGEEGQRKRRASLAIARRSAHGQDHQEQPQRTRSAKPSKSPTPRPGRPPATRPRPHWILQRSKSTCKAPLFMVLAPQNGPSGH